MLPNVKKTVTYTTTDGKYFEREDDADRWQGCLDDWEAAKEKFPSHNVNPWSAFVTAWSLGFATGQKQATGKVVEVLAKGATLRASVPLAAKPAGRRGPKPGAIKRKHSAEQRRKWALDMADRRRKKRALARGELLPDMPEGV